MQPNRFTIFIAITSLIIATLVWVAIRRSNEIKEAKSVTVMGTQVVVMSPEPGVTCYLRGMNGIFCMRR